MTDKDKEKKDNFKLSAFSWKLSDEQLKYEVENYDDLSFWKTTRGAAVALLLLSALITIVSVGLGWFPALVLFDVLLILILSFFIYRGSRAAIVLAMIYWTFTQAIKVFDLFLLEEVELATDLLLILFWWILIIKPLWNSYKIEKERRRVEVKKEKMDISKNNDGGVIYCSQCGEKVERDSNYCINCGSKVKK